MKILVDKMPNTCKECDYCAAAMIQSQLGVPKQVSLCTLQASLIPPKSPDEEPNFLDIEKSPKDNKCPFKAFDDDSVDEDIKDIAGTTEKKTSSGLILL